MAHVRRLAFAVLCAAAMALSGAIAPQAAVAQVPCGTSLKDTLRGHEQSHPGQFSPERGPCEDSVPSSPQLQPPPLILPA